MNNQLKNTAYKTKNILFKKIYLWELNIPRPWKMLVAN